jgi:hypothetical protein
MTSSPSTGRASEDLVAEFLARNKGDIVFEASWAPREPNEGEAASKLAKLAILDSELIPHVVFWFWRSNGADAWTMVDGTHWAVKNARDNSTWNGLKRIEMPPKVLEHAVSFLPENVLREV